MDQVINMSSEKCFHINYYVYTNNLFAHLESESLRTDFWKEVMLVMATVLFTPLSVKGSNRDTHMLCKKVGEIRFKEQIPQRKDFFLPVNRVERLKYH